MIKSGFDATLKTVYRELRAQNRRSARYKGDERCLTEELMRAVLALTPVVRPRGNRDAFWRRLADDNEVKAVGGLLALCDPMLVALAARHRPDEGRLPLFRKLARIFLRLLRGRLYEMPLAPMPRGMRSTLVGSVNTVRFGGKRDRKKRRQSWPAHAELVEEVRLLTGRLFFRDLAALITAGHHAHGNSEYYLGAEALAKDYRRWLKSSPGGAFARKYGRWLKATPGGQR